MLYKSRIINTNIHHKIIFIKNQCMKFLYKLQIFTVTLIDITSRSILILEVRECWFEEWPSSSLWGGQSHEAGHLHCWD